MHNIYSGFEAGVVVLLRTDSDSWLSDGSSTLLFRRWTISLADLKGKLKAVHVDSIVEQTVIHLAFEIRVQL